MQVRTRTLGDIRMNHPTDVAVIAKNADIVAASGMSKLPEKLVCPALLRKLDRFDPPYRD